MGEVCGVGLVCVAILILLFYFIPDPHSVIPLLPFWHLIS